MGIDQPSVPSSLAKSAPTLHMDRSQITPKYLWNYLSWRCRIPWRSAAFHKKPLLRGDVRGHSHSDDILSIWYIIRVIHVPDWAWDQCFFFQSLYLRHIGFCLVWKWGINPQKGYLTRETNDQPLDLGYTIFKPHMSLAAPLRTPAACHWPCTTRPPRWRCCGMLGTTWVVELIHCRLQVIYIMTNN